MMLVMMMNDDDEVKYSAGVHNTQPADVARKKPGCGPLDSAEIVSILAHSCFSLSCDRLA